MEAAARVLHPRYAALHRGGRRDSQGPPKPRCRQETACAVGLCGSTGHLPGRPGLGDHQGTGRYYGRPAQASWHERGFRRHRLGHSRRPPPCQGGWQMFHTWHSGADCINPAVAIGVRASGDKAWFGWPDVPAVEAEVAAWYEAKTLDEEKAAIRRLNKAALDGVVYAPTGFFLMYQAWRKNVSGIVKGPLPFFWGVSKTA